MTASRLATVRIAPHGWHFDALPDRSLLQSALQAGIELPSSCRNGTCRACLCRLHGGEVRYLVDWPGVSREERAERWILPCVATPVGDVELLVPLAQRVG